MEINLKEKEEESNIEIPINLLGKKIVHFSIEKESNSNKKLLTQKTKEDNLNEGRWSYIEQTKFIEALAKDGLNWKKMRNSIKTRSLPQIRSHTQKFFKRLKNCKIKELGIDFTSNAIRSINDMINHIKSVNSKYDIAKIFVFLEKKILNDSKIIKHNDDSGYININNIGNNINLEGNEKIFVDGKNLLSKNFNINNYFDLNDFLLLNLINNSENNLDMLLINYINKFILANNIINNIYINCFENIKNALNSVKQSSSESTSNSFDNIINNKIEDINKFNFKIL